MIGVPRLPGPPPRATPDVCCSYCRSNASLTEIAQWSLTSLREKVVKIGAKVVQEPRLGPAQPLATYTLPGARLG